MVGDGGFRCFGRWRNCYLGLGIIAASTTLVGCSSTPTEDNKQANWRIDLSLCNCINEEVTNEDGTGDNPAGPCWGSE